MLTIQQGEPSSAQPLMMLQTALVVVCIYIGAYAACRMVGVCDFAEAKDPAKPDSFIVRSENRAWSSSARLFFVPLWKAEESFFRNKS